jgi:hypothetical protein
LSSFFVISDEEIDGQAAVLGLGEEDLNVLFEKRGARAKFRQLLEHLKVHVHI